MKNKNTSQKGKWGKVGAPPKAIKYPKTKFTVARLVESNANVCELTIRTRIKNDVAAGVLVKVGDVKQPKSGVGRPKASFILKELAANLAPVVAKTKKVKKVKAEKTVAPVTAPVVAEVTAPVVEPTPAPVAEVTAAVVAETNPLPA